MWACADTSTKPPEVAAVSGVLRRTGELFPVPATSCPRAPLKYGL